MGVQEAVLGLELDSCEYELSMRSERGGFCVKFRVWVWIWIWWTNVGQRTMVLLGSVAAGGVVGMSAWRGCGRLESGFERLYSPV
jgi:hypothetical protein